MAIYHCQINNKGRSNGKSNAAAIAAYRSGEKLKSIDDNRTKYPHRKVSDIETTGLLNWTRSRQKLWNEVEHLENRKNSRFCKEVMIALPKELNAEQRLILVQNIGNRMVERYGSAVDYAIHRPNKKNDNYHAHILLTLRKSDGKNLARSKTREMTFKGEMYHIRKRIYEAETNQLLKSLGIDQAISGEKSEHTEKAIHHGNKPQIKEKNNDILERRENAGIERKIKSTRDEFQRVQQVANERLSRVTEEIDRISELAREQKTQSEFIFSSARRNSSFKTRIKELVSNLRDKLKIVFRNEFKGHQNELHQWLNDIKQDNEYTSNELRNSIKTSFTKRTDIREYSNIGERIRKLAKSIKNESCYSRDNENYILRQLSDKKMKLACNIGYIKKNEIGTGLISFINSCLGLNYFTKRKLKRLESEYRKTAQKHAVLEKAGERLRKIENKQSENRYAKSIRISREVKINRDNNSRGMKI